MKQYRVTTENGFEEFDDIGQAEKYFNFLKDEMMAEGVIADETYIELTSSEDDFETETVLKKLLAVVDDERTELGSPREEGCDWDYWAKWKEVDVSSDNSTGVNSVKELELLLLKMWEESGIEYIYKYKNRVKEFNMEGLARYELFYDLTNRMFRDVKDTANGDDLYPEDCKVSIRTLIENRA